MEGIESLPLVFALLGFALWVAAELAAGRTSPVGRSPVGGTRLGLLIGSLVAFLLALILVLLD